MSITTGQTFIFTSPYEQYADRIGQAATVVGEVDHSRLDHEETGPLYEVRFDDGTIIEAWPEEIDPGASLDKSDDL